MIIKYGHLVEDKCSDNYTFTEQNNGEKAIQLKGTRLRVFNMLGQCGWEYTTKFINDFNERIFIFKKEIDEKNQCIFRELK